MLPEACSEFLPELLVRLLKLLPLDKLALLWTTGIKRLQKFMDVYLGLNRYRNHDGKGLLFDRFSGS